MSATEITVFEKTGGPLTKHIRLDPAGRIVSDASACLMASGFARRVKIDGMPALADLINGFRPHQAYTLGRLKDGLPDHVRVVRADKLDGATDPAIIARTKEFLVFPDGEASLALLDADFKGMSEAATRRMEECGDLWCALCEVLPALETVACVERASTSSGLRNRETGQSFPGSGGRHIVVPVLDAADIPRFLSDLFDRCWLAGLGWGMVSAAGSFLERAIIDKAVGSPERLIFEGAPIIEPPLVQEGRAAVARDGFVLDTRSCAPLTDGERAELQKLKAAEEHRLLPERQTARAAWSLVHIKRLIDSGMPEAEARAQVDRWIDRKELSGVFPLPFDKRELAGTTVAEVLADPERFINETMSDPHEGPAYGRGTAILYRRRNGSLFIHSFAHGGLNYELKVPDDEPDGIPPEYSDEALALRLSARHERDLRYLAVFGRWYWWRGVYWGDEKTLKVFDFARALCRAASAEISDEPKLARIVASSGTVAAIEKLARADRRHATLESDWDRDPKTFTIPDKEPGRGNHRT